MPPSPGPPVLTVPKSEFYEDECVECKINLGSAEEPGSMAEPEEALSPGDKVLVTVVSAHPDILVVSYVRGTKTFQGALLDATKR